VTCALAPVAAIWTANRDAPFYPALVCLAALGAIAGVISNRLPEPSRSQLSRLPPPLIVATVYPIMVVVAIVAENWAAEESAALRSVPLIGIGILFTSIALVGRYVRPRPIRWFRSWSVVWIVVSVALFFFLFVGVAFIPLAVSYRFAASHMVES
jgi:hypothetical protein